MEFLDNYFHLREAGTSVRTELTAGMTTFMTMAYILAVNPVILGSCGMDASSVFAATATSAVIATLIMAFYANLPVALAPGMGLNAFFAFSVVLGMKHSWQFALTAVFIEGLIFILLTLTNLREAILDSLPVMLKKAISAGIGLFIAFIGLQGSGIVVKNEATVVALGSVTTPTAIVTLLGLFIASMLLIYRVRGALLISILASTLIGIPFGVTDLAHFDAARLFSVPSLAPTFCQFEWEHILIGDMLVVVLTFLFVDIFDTVGTLVGVATKGNLLDENGHLPSVKQAFMADAIGTCVGAVLGTSTVTSFVESSAGVAEGGRTGLTSLTTAAFFILALFFSPIFLLVPGAATAPALILVGLAMLSPIVDINLNDYVEAVPAYLTILIMPLTYSIANGIAFGFIAYVLLATCSGHSKEISIPSYIVAVLFILKFALF